MKLPHDRSTRISLYVLLGLLGVVVLDFIRSIMASGFMSAIGLIALAGLAPAMFVLAHHLGNHDVPESKTRQRNRDRFINK